MMFAILTATSPTAHSERPGAMTNGRALPVSPFIVIGAT